MRGNYVHLICVPRLFGDDQGNPGYYGRAEDFNVKRFLLADVADDSAYCVLYHEWGHCLGLHHPNEQCLPGSIADETWITFIMHKRGLPNMSCRMRSEDKSAFEQN